MTKRLTGPRNLLRDQRDAIDRLEGMPRPPTFIGGGIRRLIPDVFTPGAPGWTAHVCLLDEDTLTLDIPEEIAPLHQGKSVDVGGGRMVTVDLRGATDVNDGGRP